MLKEKIKNHLLKEIVNYLTENLLEEDPVNKQTRLENQNLIKILNNSEKKMLADEEYVLYLFH